MEIQQFGSFDEMMDSIGRDEDYALSRITDDQREMLDGEKHYMVSWPDYPERIIPEEGAGELLLVYSEVWSHNDLVKEYTARIKEIKSKEKQTEEELEEIEEKEYEIVASRSKLESGLVFTKSYSMWCEEGELGSRNVVTAREITEEEFEAAKKNNWKLTIEVFAILPERVQYIIRKGLGL